MGKALLALLVIVAAVAVAARLRAARLDEGMTALWACKALLAGS